MYRILNIRITNRLLQCDFYLVLLLSNLHRFSQFHPLLLD
nr:MAG TPA: hypothetical protein [Bacteriophage sp.]